MKNTFSIGACGAVLLSLLFLSSCAYEGSHQQYADNMAASEQKRKTEERERVERIKQERAAEQRFYSSMRSAGKPIAYKKIYLEVSNSVGLYSFSISDFANLSDKTIKYFKISVGLYNRVGDKIYSSAKRLHIIPMSATGPYPPVTTKTPKGYRRNLGDDLRWKPFYCDAPLGDCRYRGVIHYMDGNSRSFTHEEFLSWKLPSQ